MKMFLTPDEMILLTGRQRKSCQIRWLRANGVPFRINASGRPIVASSVIHGDGLDLANFDEWRPAALYAPTEQPIHNGQKTDQALKPSA